MGSPCVLSILNHPLFGPKAGSCPALSPHSVTQDTLVVDDFAGRHFKATSTHRTGFCVIWNFVSSSSSSGFHKKSHLEW